MNIDEGLLLASQILEQERRFPSVKYTFSPTPNSAFKDSPLQAMAASLSALSGFQELTNNRNEVPRTVFERTKGRCEFSGQNYELLVSLLAHVSEDDRPTLLMKMAELIGVFPGALASSKPVYPSYVWYNSELPLVAEFLARNDGRQLLFNHIRDAQVSPGIAIMLIELADMVAFNNEIFSQAECSSLEKALDSLRRKAVHLADSAIAPPERWKQLRENYKTAAQFVARHCDEIMELIRQAQFIRVRSVLKDEINLEINQDKYVVQGFLTKLGFSEPLIASLNEAERLNHSTASPFELKSSMGHLRSFMEHLHSESIPTICASKKVSSPEAKWGNLLFFLRENDVISKAEEHFLSGLFVLISDEAVHPIIAEREYARLARNMVIEYAVLFLRRLDKLGYSGRAAITQLP